MHVLLVGKYPPIQGGVSHNTFWLARSLAKHGHHVHVLTNASEVEHDFRQLLYGKDLDVLSADSLPGKIYLHDTGNEAKIFHIPYSPVYMSKLFGLGLTILEEFDCELILAYYFEPYGLVASQLAHIHNKRFVLLHAGSDVGRLSKHPHLRKSYEWMLKQANMVHTEPKSESHATLKQLGLQKSQQGRIANFLSWKEYMTLGNKFDFDLEEVVTAMDGWYEKIKIREELQSFLRQTNNKKFDPNKPTIGMYGKVGSKKHNSEVLQALARLSEENFEYNFIWIAVGGKYIARSYEEIFSLPNVSKNTWILPAIAPWRIAPLIKQCDLVFFLEHNFEITFHTPRVPLEVLLNESCLICTKEVAEKPGYGEFLEDKKTFLQIQDPTDTEELTKTLRYALLNETTRKRIAVAGRTRLEELLAEDEKTAKVKSKKEPATGSPPKGLTSRLTGPREAPVVLVLGGISQDCNLKWWPSIIDPQGPINDTKFRLLSVNWILSPEVTSHDQAHAILNVLNERAIKKLHAVIGCSYGGMVALALGELASERIDRIIAVAAAHRSHSLATAWRWLQKQMAQQAKGVEDLYLARALGMTTFRSDHDLDSRFGDKPEDLISWLSFHGQKYTERFSRNEQILLASAGNRHRINPQKIKTNTALIGVDSDMMVPPWLIDELASQLLNFQKFEVKSPYGHDGWIKETAQVREILSLLLK